MKRDHDHAPEPAEPHGGRESEFPSAAPDPTTATPPVTENAWHALKQFTRARLALGRAGNSLPTAELLRFQLDHARATDAVRRPLQVDQLCDTLRGSRRIAVATGDTPIVLNSKAADRQTFLQRPDLGRQLEEMAWQQLHERAAARAPRIDLAIVIADGLSSAAVQHNAPPFIESLLAQLEADARPWQLAPLIIATQSRVAIGDDIGESLNAHSVIVLIGERPGLSSPDSMGAYLTWAPRRGTLDSSRNCLSNIRPEGYGADAAGAKAYYLIREAFRLQRSGIALKDRAHDSLECGASGTLAGPRFRLTDGGPEERDGR